MNGTVYETKVKAGDGELTLSTTDAEAAAEWSKSGLRVTAETGCGL